MTSTAAYPGPYIAMLRVPRIEFRNALLPLGISSFELSGILKWPELCSGQGTVPIYIQTSSSHVLMQHFSLTE